MAVETLVDYNKMELETLGRATPMVIVTLGEDGVMRLAKTDPTTGALVVSGASGGDATAANQASQIALETAIRDRLISGGPQTGSGTASATTQRVTLATDVALPAGTNVLGKTGYKLVKATTNFTRPADTTAYAIGDAVTNSTSSPTVFQLDLGALGAVAGQAIEIRKLAVVSSVKGSVLPLFNVFLSDATFTATNDNAALDIADATQEADGAWFACDVQNFTASNARVSYINVPSPMLLAAADTKLYGTIQAANAYTPASGEKFTIIAWVALL